jgi:hypothetical protein
VPSLAGLPLIFIAFPPLTWWANEFRPCGTGVEGLTAEDAEDAESLQRKVLSLGALGALGG